MTQLDDDRIRGKVAAILSVRELILNVGSQDGVSTGMRFVILTRNSVTIKDPDTGNPIGKIHVPKTVVKVVRVDGENMSIARTFRTVKGNPGILGAAAGLRGTPDEPETLNIASGASLRSQLPQEDWNVMPGDLALLTTGDEYDDL